jgi:sugar lactone lactonase YvrE
MKLERSDTKVEAFGTFNELGATPKCTGKRTGTRGWKNPMIGLKKYSYLAAAKATAVLLAILSVVFFGAPASGQTTPAYVVSSRTLLTTNIAGAAGNYAVNSRGDFFVMDGGSIYNGGFKVQHLLEFPANGGAPIVLFTDASANGPNGVAVDPFDNLFLTEDQGPQGNNDVDSGIYQFPSTNQTYPGPSIYNSSVPPGSCNPYEPAIPVGPNSPAVAAVPANTAVCAAGLFQGTAFYYWQPFGIAADGLGNFYFYSNYDNTYGSTAKGIYACNPTCLQQGLGGQGTQLTPTPGNTGAIKNTITSIASDYAGDVFYTDLTSVWELPVAGRATIFSTHEIPVVFDTTYTNPFGVQFDASGNMYVSDANGIWEVPSVEMTGGAPCKGGTDACMLVPASKFKLIPLPGLEQTNTAPCYTSNLYSSVAVDTKGNIVYSYSCPQYDQRNLYKSSLWSGTFPAAEVGSAASAPLPFTIQFDQATTLTSIAAIQGAAASTEFTLSPGTCTTNTAFAANSSCTFTVTFTPGGVGPRSGAVTITDSTGKVTTTALSGVGNGTSITVDPGTPKQVGATFQQSTGIAVDAAANVYVADSKANTVTEYPAGGGTPVSIGTGLSVPTGVAVDGSGNVFIVNQGTGDQSVTTGTPPDTVTTEVGTGTVVEVPNISGVLTNSAQTTVVSALHTPTDIALDSAANIYVSATGSNEVLQFSSAIRSGQTATRTVRGYGLSAPTGIAVDSAGNVYVADTGNNQVLELGDGFQTPIGNGLSAPTGVAVDPSGSVIIADGSGRLIRVPNETGQGGVGLNQADQQVLDSPLSYPYSVRLDLAGNIYVSDNNVNAVYELVRTAGAVDFGDWNVNTVSDPQTLVVSNSGTDPVTLGNPLFAPVPAASGFTVTQGTSSQACGSGTFNSGYSCQLIASFAPTAGGQVSYPLVLAAPNTTNPTPTINLQGNGVMLDAATLTVSQLQPVGAIAYGETIQFQATITPSGSTPTPTGFVVFSFDGQNYRPTTVNAGVAVFTFPLVNAGPHSISAHYLGDANYPELVSTSVPVNISLSPSTNTLVILADSATPLSAAQGSTVTMTDTILPAETGLLQGTVTFLNEATTPATVLDVVTLGSEDKKTHAYTATFAFNSANGLRNGVYQIAAVFSGNTNYSTNTSAVQTLTIVNPSFTVTLDKTATTATGSAPGVINLTVTDYSNYQAGVTFQCAPASTSTASATTSTSTMALNEFAPNAFCVFRPLSAQLVPALNVIPNTIPPVQMALQFQVDQSLLVVEGSFGWIGAALALLLVIVWRKRVPTRGLKLTSLLVVLCLGGIASLSGCGSGSGSGFKTPAGTYNLVLTATATPEINGTTPLCSLVDCSLPASPTNPSINTVQTYNVSVTVK